VRHAAQRRVFGAWGESAACVDDDLATSCGSVPTLASRVGAWMKASVVVPACWASSPSAGERGVIQPAMADGLRQAIAGVVRADLSVSNVDRASCCPRQEVLCQRDRGALVPARGAGSVRSAGTSGIPAAALSGAWHRRCSGAYG
jgi:hypothetical protein